MYKYQKTIEKICKFSFFFSNMDTIFINPSSQITLEFGHNPIPDSLIPYIGDVNQVLHLNETTSVQDVVFHSLSVRMNYISSRVYDDQQNYLGNIVVGPYLLEEPSALMIQDVLFENKLPLSLKHILTQYYLTLPALSAYKAETIAEFLAFNTKTMSSIYSQNIEIGKISYNFQTEFVLPPEIINKNADNSSDLIEKRYNIENELMLAVEKGDKDKAEKLVKEDFSTIKQNTRSYP